MGYFKIILVGLLWIICLILPIRQWLTLIMLPIALWLPFARPYANKLFKSDDQNMLAFLNGHEDRTISGYVGYKSLKGDKVAKQAEKVINAIFFWQKDHCRKAIDWEEYEEGKKGLIG